MALLYPWATKEYLLEKMTLGQILSYHNIGIEMKFGKPAVKKPITSLVGQPYDVIKAERDKLIREQYCGVS